MVTIQRENRKRGNLQRYLVIASALALGLIVFFSLKSETRSENRLKPQQGLPKHQPKVPGDTDIVKPQQKDLPEHHPQVKVPGDKDIDTKSPACPYKSFDDLSPEELFPTKGSRHMVNPPSGGQLTLVCCETTKGPWSLVVHDQWAPLGATRFLEMVSSRYMDSEIPLFRCIQGFLCQFGLSSDVSLLKRFKETIQDDKNWLPQGPSNRERDNVKRFAKGYIAYAAEGENSRNKQLIVSLIDVGGLGGTSPWEVPFGELVGKHSFETLDKIYTGYGENGPKQGQLSSGGMDEQMRTEFPDLDYLKSCHIVDQRMQPEKV